MVAIWNGIAEEGRTDFYEWHNREHMPSASAFRASCAGGATSRTTGHSEFFTLYEARCPRKCSVGQDHLNRLNNPTPWTARVPPKYFRDTSRGICRVKLSLGVGQGGWILTLRLACVEGREDELEKHLRHAAPPPLADIIQVTGVHLAIADQAGSRIETAEKKGRPVDGIPSWLVMIEGGTAEACDEACDKLLAGDLTKHGAEAKSERGLYSLQYSRSKTPGWA